MARTAKSRKPLRPSRRTMLAGGAALGFTLGLPAIVRAQSKTIVMTSPGGIYEKNFKKNVLDPYARKAGIKFELKYGSPSEALTNAIVNRDDPEIDILFLVLPIAVKASKTRGVFLELKPDMIPNLKDVDSVFYDTYGRKAVGFNYVDGGIAYRTDMVANPPKGEWPCDVLTCGTSMSAPVGTDLRIIARSHVEPHRSGLHSSPDTPEGQHDEDRDHRDGHTGQ